MSRRLEISRWMIVAVLTLAALWVAPRVIGEVFLINATPSVPTGLYVRDFGATIARNAIVAVEQPLAAQRVLAPLGYPTDAALMKEVAGLSGDAVCADDEAVMVAGHGFPAPVASILTQGFPAWTECRALRSDELFLLGAGATSFDSRSFGPVPIASVRGVYRRLLTW